MASFAGEGNRMPMALFVIPDRTYAHAQRRVAYILVVVWVRHYRYADVRLCCQVDSEAKDRRMIVQAYTVSVLTQKEVRRVSTVWGDGVFVCAVSKQVCVGLLFWTSTGVRATALLNGSRDEEGYLSIFSTDIQS